MNYKQTVEYLFSRLPMFQRIGAAAYKANLDNTIKICSLLAHPEHKFKSIHVAGTNGKGSTSHMLASVYAKAGYKVGLYTSPHLKDFRERIKINGKDIPKKYIVDFVKKYKDDFEKIEPSFFEWTVGLAFNYFAEKKVDIAIIEVGLGGRLDSTNVITPELSLITNISYDHMNLLGNTLPEIAAEKAGIIKPGIPLVVSQSQSAVKNVFIQKAKKEKIEIFFADKIYRHISEKYIPAQFLTEHVFSKGNKRIKVKTDLPGTYQQYNLPGVLCAVDMLAEKFPLRKKEITSALKEVKKLSRLHGRWEVIGKNPLIICDTGHNEDGLKQVLLSVKREFDCKTVKGRLHVVFGVVNDKDLGKVFSLLKKDRRFSKAAYYFCKPAIPRGLDASALQQAALKAGIKGEAFPSVKKALKAAKTQARKNELVFVGGSTFTVAEVL